MRALPYKYYVPFSHTDPVADPHLRFTSATLIELAQPIRTWDDVQVVMDIIKRNGFENPVILNWKPLGVAEQVDDSD